VSGLAITRLPQEVILELYFNIAEWGEGIFGINRAARTYFNKSPAELNAKEGAFLAMLLPSPKKYSISFRQKGLTPYARKTIRSILGKMVQAKILTPEERAEEWAKPYSWEAKPEITPVDEDSSDEKDIQDESGTDDANNETADDISDDSNN
jgi:monofunctional biosynthetic peptidoglycan transglycosylase